MAVCFSRRVLRASHISLLACSAAIAGLTASGCQKSESAAPLAVTDAKPKDSTNDEPRPSLKPNDILGRMVQAYRNATSYADAAQLRITIERDGRPSNDPEPFNASVSFVRPNKVRIQCQDAMLVDDGKKLRASVGSVRHQVVELDAPPKLAIGNLFLGDAFYDSLAQGIGGFPIQLALLLDPNPLAAILPEGSVVSAMPAASFDGHACQRVKIDLPDGARVFWIDSESYVLRLIELPTEMLRRQIEANEGPVKRVAVTLELLGARLNEPVPEAAFQFEVPADAKLVKQLIRPPHPVSGLLGKPIPEFKFAGINGPPLSRKSAAGKVAVIEFWFTGCGPCQVAFPQLAKVHEKYKDSDRVAMVGVSVDQPQVDEKQIQETAAGWGATFPIARDSAGEFQTAFEGSATPALFVLGPDGTVQYSEVGLNPELTKELPATIDALLAGKSTWEEAKARDRQRQDEYARRIQEPPAPFTAVEDLPATKIVPRDEPKSIKRAKAWETSELKAPGNLLVIDADGAEPKLFAMDGPRTVVELTPDGKVAARHELKIPEQAVVSFLRTAVDRLGHRYFAGSGSGQQQLFLFDADWKLLLSFPAADQGKHAGIGDVQFIDLEELGTSQLAVGYWGIVGVQMIALNGTRIKADRSLEFVLSMAQSGADTRGLHRLLCTNSSGSVVPIDSTGAAEPEWRLQGIMLETIAAADIGGGHKSICAIARNTEGTPLAIGLSDRGEDLWRYVLPRGIFRTPVEPLTSANLIGDSRHWLIAGPDGSIHFVAADGTALDQFHYGQALTGLAGIRFGNDRLLLVSTAKGLAAWRIEGK
jgi:thiol-disulfide isomerase/thioredoxin